MRSCGAPRGPRGTIDDDIAVQTVRAVHLRRRARAADRQPARLRSDRRRAGSAAPAGKAEASGRDQARDHREHARDQHLGASHARRPARRAEDAARRGGARRPTGSTSASPEAARTRSSAGTTGASSRMPRFQLPERAVRLPRQAVHRVRPAHPRRLPQTATRRCACCTAVSRYIPHFIALSASSPFLQGWTPRSIRRG